jgi:hypothetical protein
MNKKTTLLLVGGGALALYLYSKSQGQAGYSGQGALPSGGGYYNPAAYVPVQYGGTMRGLGATRPRFRH